VIYLLDTDTLIYMIRGLKPRSRKRPRAERMVAKCQSAQDDGHTVGLSSITVSELEYGARRSRDYAAELRAVHKVLLPFELFDYDAIRAPHAYGRLRHDLDQAGTPIGAMDLLIAAHALALSATLVSNNLGHFRRVQGLQVENWS
jgi:tRNA(fMet)-specific endonuclease VapC